MVLSPYFIFATGAQDVSNCTTFNGGFTSGIILDDISSVRFSDGALARWDFGSAQTELWYHFFVRFSSIMTTSGLNQGAFIQIGKNPAKLFELRFNPITRKIEAWAPGQDPTLPAVSPPPVLLATGNQVFNGDQVYHIQLHYKMANSGGIVQTKIDKTSTDATYDINFSGDTQPGAEVNFDQLIIRQNFNAGSDYVYFSSLYVDSAGFQGILRIKTYKPNRDGLYTAWPKSTGTTAWTLLKDVPHDSDATYIYSQTLGQKQSVGFEPFDGPTNSQILANCHVYMSRRISSGSFNAYARSNGTEGAPLNIVPGSNYRSNVNIMQLDPNTSAAWTVPRLQDQTATGVEAIEDMQA